MKKERFYYNDLIISKLDVLKFQKKISINDIALEIGVNPKELYTIRNKGKMAGDAIWNLIDEKYPEISIDKMEDETFPNYETGISTQKKLILAYEELIELQRGEIERLKIENASLKARIKSSRVEDDKDVVEEIVS
jgi:hypothetical protein